MWFKKGDSIQMLETRFAIEKGYGSSSRHRVEFLEVTGVVLLTLLSFFFSIWARLSAVGSSSSAPDILKATHVSTRELSSILYRLHSWRPESSAVFSDGPDMNEYETENVLTSTGDFIVNIVAQIFEIIDN